MSHVPIHILDNLFLDPNEEDPLTLWAAIAKLQAAVKGPEGFATWQEAATDERRRRVLAEQRASTIDSGAVPVQYTTFRLGQIVKKKSGSEWQGTVVGWYSTKLTPEGYAVESSTHKGSVQIYPATALEAAK